MSKKRAVGRSMVWNTAGLAVEAGTGFVVMPFLIARLGEQTYGVWVVLGALTSYFTLLDLGVRGAIGRYIALHRAQDDQPAVNQTFTAGLAVLAAGAVVVLVTVFGLTAQFFRWFDVPPDQHAEVGLALRLVAVSFALALVSFAFDATLWGFTRFDWINAVDIPSTLVRAGLTFWLIAAGGGLVALAVITLGVTAANGLAKAVLCFRANPRLRAGPRHFRPSAVRSLIGFGSWGLIYHIARITRTQLSPLLIGSYLGVALVTPYSVAARLLSLVASAMGATVGVLTPFATELHATQQADRQRQLFLIGGRHTCGFAAFMIAFLLALGGPLIALWVGPGFGPAVTLLVILALGELLPSTQWATGSILYAAARYQAVGLLSVFETIAVWVLAVVLLPVLGLPGAGLAVAVPAFLVRGVAPLIQGCWVVGVPVSRYLAVAIVPPLLCAAGPALAVGLLADAYPPATWPLFVAYSAAYTALFAAGYACLLGRAQVKGLGGWLAGALARTRPETAARPAPGGPPLGEPGGAGPAGG